MDQPNQPDIFQEPPQSSRPEIPPKPHLPVWLVALIIAITAIIVIGLVGWAAYQSVYRTPAELPLTAEEETPSNLLPKRESIDPTADWQTYRNEEYGFEFKYPNDWKVEEGNEGIIQLLEIYPETSEIYYDDSYIHMALIPSSGYLGPGPGLEEYKNQFENPELFCPKEEIFPLDDHPYLNEINYGKVATIHFGCEESNLVNLFFRLVVQQASKETTVSAGKIVQLNEPNKINLNKKAWIKSDSSDFGLMGIVATIKLDYYESLFTPKGSFDPISPEGESKLEEIKKEIEDDKISDSTTSDFIKLFNQILSTFKFIP